MIHTSESLRNSLWIKKKIYRSAKKIEKRLYYLMIINNDFINIAPAKTALQHKIMEKSFKKEILKTMLR